MINEIWTFFVILIVSLHSSSSSRVPVDSFNVVIPIQRSYFRGIQSSRSGNVIPVGPMRVYLDECHFFGIGFAISIRRSSLSFPDWTLTTVSCGDITRTIEPFQARSIRIPASEDCSDLLIHVNKEPKINEVILSLCDHDDLNVPEEHTPSEFTAETISTASTRSTIRRCPQFINGECLFRSARNTMLLTVSEEAFQATIQCARLPVLVTSIHLDIATESEHWCSGPLEIDIDFICSHHAELVTQVSLANGSTECQMTSGQASLDLSRGHLKSKGWIRATLTCTHPKHKRLDASDPVLKKLLSLFSTIWDSSSYDYRYLFDERSQLVEGCLALMPGFAAGVSLRELCS